MGWLGAAGCVVGWGGWVLEGGAAVRSKPPHPPWGCAVKLGQRGEDHGLGRHVEAHCKGLGGEQQLAEGGGGLWGLRGDILGAQGEAPNQPRATALSPPPPSHLDESVLEQQLNDLLHQGEEAAVVHAWREGVGVWKKG
jgi:hypothetical protein